MSRMLIRAAMPEHVKIDGRQLQWGSRNDKIVRDPAVYHHAFHQGDVALAESGIMRRQSGDALAG
jgi:hypothetical protein